MYLGNWKTEAGNEANHRRKTSKHSIKFPSSHSTAVQSEQMVKQRARVNCDSPPLTVSQGNSFSPNNTACGTLPKSSGPPFSGRNKENSVAASRNMSYERSSKKKKHKRTASITDLRPEDKKKVANLIQELANLGSEKEKIERFLKKERKSFEDAIKDLVSDQKNLLSERQAVQGELHSCQQMLSQLQEAVLHRPTSSTVSSVKGEDNERSIMYGSKPSDFSRHSALEAYISKHNNTLDMDAASDVESVTSDAIKHPRYAFP